MELVALSEKGSFGEFQVVFEGVGTNFNHKK